MCPRTRPPPGGRPVAGARSVARVAGAASAVKAVRVARGAKSGVRESSHHLHTRVLEMAAPEEGMTQTDAQWDRLKREFSAAMETLGALEGAARTESSAADLQRLASARQGAAEVARQLELGAPRENPARWKAWVSAQTAWLEFRFEMHHLAAAPGRFREAFLASVAIQIGRLDEEIRGLERRSGRFRPRTRLAIAREVDRLHRRLDVLRSEIGRLDGSDASSDEGVIRDIGHAWSDASWAVEATRARYTRPRWRQEREAPSLPAQA